MDGTISNADLVSSFQANSRLQIWALGLNGSSFAKSTKDRDYPNANWEIMSCSVAHVTFTSKNTRIPTRST